MWIAILTQPRLPRGYRSSRPSQEEVLEGQAASIVESLLGAAPATLDLADESQLEEVTSAAERLVESFPTRRELAELESVLCERKAEVPLAVHLAVKLARSRRVILDLDRPLHLSVVFAV
jgi:hypothetical protein